MSWRENLRPGAFRGVSFFIESAEQVGGRRAVLNEYPLRDVPSVEDLGRKARQFSLELFVVGQEYMSQRDQLIEALEGAGPGTLMHPYRGELQVVVLGEYRVSESTREGGLARISVTFAESGEPPRPEAKSVAGSLGNASADAVQAEAVAEFEDEFSVTGFASHVVEGTVAVLQDATSAILGAGGLLNGAGEFGALYRQLTGSVQQLILAPGALAGKVLGLVRGLTGSFSNPLLALQAQLSLFGLGGRSKPAAGSGSSAQLQANQTAIYRLIERAAVSEAVRLAVSSPVRVAASQPVAGVAYDNRDQAVQIRDRVLEELDRQQLVARPERYRALARLSADLVVEVNRAAANLVPLTRIVPPTTMPALLLAHLLYGDARQADQIVARNRLSHPGFVPGGRELEVLKNA
ncbi:hypothetical protein D9M70_422840 [compost metagenome]